MSVLNSIMGGALKRQSNIELARLLSMFLILVIHANMVSLPRPSSIDLEKTPLPVISRYFFESVGIVSVDVFVMISGWFLINVKTKSVLSFIYQIVFFWGGGYLLMLIHGNADFSKNGILRCFAFTEWDWFIKAYLVLMIISPILNSYIANASDKSFRKVLFYFFLFACTFGWIGGARRFFVDGYGPLSFIVLYLLSNYARHACENSETPRLIKKIFGFNKYVDLIIFIVISILNTAIGVFSLKLNLPLYTAVYAYINPLVIVGSMYFLLFFSKLNLKQNNIINWLAASSFAVYLLHSQFDLRPFFTEYVQTIYNSYSGLLVIVFLALYLVCVYLLSVVIDQLRIISWNFISKKLG